MSKEILKQQEIVTKLHDDLTVASSGDVDTTLCREIMAKLKKEMDIYMQMRGVEVETKKFR